MRRFASIIVAAGVLVATISAARNDKPNQPADLTVHEWGTFTSVAGEDGRAVEWRALAGATDLPCFVDRPGSQGWINKLSFTAMVRMETPVLYFYAPREMNASAKVRFPLGVMTEWYPKTTSKQGGQLEVTGLEWNDVRVRPESNPAFPTEPGESHYYTARNTDAAPLRVNNQDEKFLFYRGVGKFQPPISVRLSDRKVLIENLAKEPIPFAVVFENRAGKPAFHYVKNVTGSVTVDRDELNAYPNDLWVRDILAKILVVSGLYGKEAQAMVNTWRDSWFEEGMRVFYIVPTGEVDGILPLEIQPKPAQIARVFVGRMEVITPEMQNAVVAAVQNNDQEQLSKQGRFLGAVIDRLMKTASGEEHARFQTVLNRATDKAFSADLRCK
jgi:hypothetical protein